MASKVLTNEQHATDILYRVGYLRSVLPRKNKLVIINITSSYTFADPNCGTTAAADDACQQAMSFRLFRIVVDCVIQTEKCQHLHSTKTV